MKTADHIGLGEELFRFDSLNDWILTSRRRFEGYRVDGVVDAVCVDARGRLCRTGGDFQRAADEDAYPVVVYSVIQPTGGAA